MKGKPAWYGKRAPTLPPGLTDAWFRAGLALGMLSDGTCPGRPRRADGSEQNSAMWPVLGRVLATVGCFAALTLYVGWAVFGGR
jgi:hypothetical protein